MRPESLDEDDEDHPPFDEPDELGVEELDEDDPWEPESWAVRPVSLLSVGGVRVWATSVGSGEGSSLGVLGSLDTLGSLGALGVLGSLGSGALGVLGSLAGSKVREPTS